MNENKSPKETCAFFNYTLLLDDIMEPRLGPFSKDPQPSHTLLASPGKCSMGDCKTQAFTNATHEASDIESPLKIDLFDKNGKHERLRKSDGALYLAAQNKSSGLKDFLSEQDQEEIQGEHGMKQMQWDFDFSEEILKVGETLSDAPRENVSNFSLSSCFKNKLSEFTLSSFIHEGRGSRMKISGKKLRKALGKRHFDRVLLKLSKVVESGGSYPS
jgi:hypothetical protein